MNIRAKVLARWDLLLKKARTFLDETCQCSRCREAKAFESANKKAGKK